MQNSIRVTCEYPQVIVNRRYQKLSSVNQRQFSTLPDYYLQVPCGRCSLCKARIAREWKVRLSYEMECTREHRHNSQLLPRVVFLTFTFRDDALPDNEDLFADWLVKFRDSYRKRYGRSPRYWAITDRGSQFARLHLHMLLFDPRKWSRKEQRYVSDVSISDLKRHNFWWHYGFVDAQWVRYRSVSQYVVGYLTGANLEQEEPIKHGKPICKEALEYKPHIYPSKGLGAGIIDSSFVRYVCSRDLETIDLNGYVYGLPRYYFEKVLDQLGTSRGGNDYYSGLSPTGKRVKVNLLKDEILFHRQAVNKEELVTYKASKGFDPDTYRFQYGKNTLTPQGLRSTLSLTSRFVTPETDVGYNGSVLSSSQSDFVDIIELPPFSGLCYKYYPIQELHYAPELVCPF